METSEKVSIAVFLKCIVECSEKAARIAQICRSEKELFKLLVEEKTGAEKNQRFVHDFKTLADVLIQETIRWQISKMFPKMRSSIRGEESNHFQNSLGQSIDVYLCDSIEDTISLLSKVLDGNQRVAEMLVKCAYEDVSVTIEMDETLKTCFISPENIGVWIDPIDATYEYINGSFENPNEYGLVVSGLQCACTLIGAYEKYSGKPIMGVINQPFQIQHLDKWKSTHYWGICYNELNQSSILNLNSEKTKKRIVTGNSEDSVLLAIMQNEYNVTVVAGAGYKCLAVVRDDADLYVLSKGTTYLWDTCGPHSLLCAKGGGIVDFQKAISARCLDCQSDIDSLQLSYNILDMEDKSRINMCCNKNGIIAYKDKTDLVQFIKLLQKREYKIYV